MPARKSTHGKRRSRAIRTRRPNRSAAWWTGTPAMAGAAMIAIGTLSVGLFALTARPEPNAMRADAPIVRHAPGVPTAATVPPTASAATTEPLPPGSPEPVADTKAAPVTISGCLERADESFRLTDIAGDNAPMSRSWKTAFLKKRPAAVDVIDAQNRLELARHVGQRVAVTGVLADREMKGRSLQRLASSCATGPKVKV